MSDRFSIARKIFGLAVILLCLNTIVAALFIRHITKLHEDFQIINRRGVPLLKSLAKINDDGLRQRLAFERWFGALNRDNPNVRIMNEARDNYDVFTEKLAAELTNARQLLDLPTARDRHPEFTAEIRILLDQLEPAQRIIIERQKEVLDLQRTGRRDAANDILNVLNDLQTTAQNQRELILAKVADMMQIVSQAGLDREWLVIWLAVAVTAASVLLGLILAAMITRRLVRPIRSLVSGIGRAEKGDLGVELPIVSRDEIGELTRSFNYFVHELRSKEDIKRTFGTYIDPRIVEQVILRPGAATSGRRIMTVSFADLVGFTGISEQLSPSGMVNLLNRHFTLQALAIQQYQGIIDKFMGDAIMAFWGPPFTAEDNHALLACRAAMGQLKALETLHSELGELTGLRKNMPLLDLRIGISAGEVVVGNIGAENARSYTIIGDTVNLGQRLEQANRIYGTRILLSEAARTAVGDDLVTREIDLLVPKGKTEPIRVFELLGLKGEVPETHQLMGQRFASALAAYRGRNWNQAESLLNECLKITPDDGPSKLFLDRIHHLRAYPPNENWCGIWFLETK
jgi:adenylate cyclase